MTEQLVQLRPEDLERLISSAVEDGIRKALTEDPDIAEVRNLLDAWRQAKRCAWQTVVRVVTTAFLAALAAGIAIKMKG